LNSDWIKAIEKHELPAKYAEMSDIIGIENTIKLAEHFGKDGFYFKSIEKIITKKKEEYIRNNFTGNNHTELARATGYSTRWIYEVLKGTKDDRQVDMFKADNE